MPLTLITGPANAAKAGAVLERYRAALAREPLLVVPTPADAEHYGRELAAEGIVVGAEVVTFEWLVRGIARATGVRPRVLGSVARERVVRAVVAETRLSALGPSAAAPGFPAAAGALFAELGRSLVTPARFTRALRTWAAAGDAPPFVEELAALYSGYHRRLEALAAVDAEGLARAALDALRERPAAWGGRPVFLYGFDDLTPLQRDAVETLARHADVCVALAYEPGRAAFAGRAGTVLDLEPLAERHEVLADRSEHYAPRARTALHHLERSLFEPAPARLTPNGAVRLLEAGGERAEAELVAAAVLELLAGGVVPEDIAVIAREGEPLAQVLSAYGVAASLERNRSFERTRLGAGVLAAARAALPGGTAADLLTWLRTPGRLADPDAADALETRVRRTGVRSAAEARRLLQRLDARAAARAPDPHAAGGLAPEPAPAPAAGTARALGAALDALADAAAGGAEAFLDALVAEADAIWTGPHRRQAAVLDPEDAADARAAAALRRAAKELQSLAASDPALAGTPAELLESLASVAVREPAAPGGVLVADPLAIRARRFRAVFVCGLQEGAFPRHPAPEPFLDDAARAALARATGLVLRRHEDTLPEERYLFYAAVSRPEEVLFLSFRSSDEEGDPVQPSAFVDDVRALFTDELWDRRGKRVLAEVTWPPRDAPTAHELRRARAAEQDLADPPALAPPSSAPVLATLGERRTEAARGLETFAGCGVRWLVESLLRPERVEPDPDAMRRGSLAHQVLERTLRRLRERTGSGRLTPASLPAALEELEAAMADLRRDRRRHPRPRDAARARRRPAPPAAPRGRGRRGARAGPARMGLRRRGRRASAAPAARGRPRRDRPGRPHRRGGRRPRADHRLQGPLRHRGRALGAGQQAAGRALRAGGARAARRRAGRRALPAGRAPRRPPARPRPRRHAGPLRQRRRRRRGGVRGRPRGRPRGRDPRGDRDARRPHPRLPRLVLAQGLLLPGDLPRPRHPGGQVTALGVRRPRRSAPPRDERAAVRFTGEQRAAIEDRTGSALLAANAGSGKTAVMVERFVEAVLHDDVAVGAVLALTFTEKAAGELRERVRRRFVALGEHERAREADAAWISTIHGFCARILRARPLAAGLDPRFTVLDEAAAKRLADQAYERALESWAAARGAPAVDLAAAYGPTLSEIVLAAHEGLRSRGEGRPRLAIPPDPPLPDPAELLAARSTAAAALALAGAGKKVSAARDALEACERVVADSGAVVPMPALLDPAKVGAGAKALEDDACVAYRTDSRYI